MPSRPVPNRLVTQTLPWLSMPRPLLLIPVLKFSTLLGSEAGKRVTCSTPLFATQYPNVTTRGHDDSLHEAKPAAEINTLRRRQGLAILIEHRDGFAAICGEPGIVLGIDRGAERASFHSSTA